MQLCSQKFRGVKESKESEMIIRCLDGGGGLGSGAIERDRKYNRGDRWRGGQDLRFGNGQSVGLFRQRQMWDSSVYVDAVGSSEHVLRVNVLTKGQKS